MKMFFSIKKNPIEITNNQLNNKTIENINEKKRLYTINSYSMRYSIIERIKNSSNCSSCDK